MVVPPADPKQVEEALMPAKFDPTLNELRVHDGIPNPHLKAGDWVVVSNLTNPSLDEWHARVMDTKYYPLIKLGQLIKTRALVAPSTQADIVLPTTVVGDAGDAFGIDHPPQPPEGISHVDVNFMAYNQQFDDLRADLKCQRIISLLNTLPRVSEMSQWLQRNTGVGDKASLKKWEQRISPSALACLRWIIASNRSCIVALKTADENNEETKSQDMHSTPVYGMGQWLQFRFAMGAPDKEQRFVRAMKETQQRLNLTCKF